MDLVQIWNPYEHFCKSFQSSTRPIINVVYIKQSLRYLCVTISDNLIRIAYVQLRLRYLCVTISDNLIRIAYVQLRLRYLSATLLDNSIRVAYVQLRLRYLGVTISDNSIRVAYVQLRLRYLGVTIPTYHTLVHLSVKYGKGMEMFYLTMHSTHFITVYMGLKKA